MRKFALLAAVCFSLTALADSLSANSITLSAFAGGGIYDGMFDFSAFGEVDAPFALYPQHTPPTTVSFTWNKSFELPASPAYDYFEVTTANTYSTEGDIIVNGETYSNGDDLDFVGHVPPDPDYYQHQQSYFGPHTMRMDLTGPIFIYAYGNFTNEYDRENCCTGSVNAYGFDQFLQIERFHADGTPDPFPSAPEPASFGLLGMALLPVGWMIRRSSAKR